MRTILASSLLVAVSTWAHAQNRLSTTEVSAGTYSVAPREAFTKFPQRLKNAPTGSQMMSVLKKLSSSEREQVLVNEILSGNFPEFLRDLKPVHFSKKLGNGSTVTLTTFVMPDYLAIGSNDDYVRIPLNLISANKLNESFRTMLPTRKIVNEIYKQANIKLKPHPMKPGPKMTSTQYFWDHHRTIEKQLKRKASSLDVLVAGHKKDVVQTRLLLKKPQAIAIFGWHRLKSQKPIQPLSTVHGAGYADYSHGIRLISRWGFMELDGKHKKVYLPNILNDRSSWSLISDEGRIRSPQLSKNS